MTNPITYAMWYNYENQGEPWKTPVSENSVSITEDYYHSEIELLRQKVKEANKYLAQQKGRIHALEQINYKMAIEIEDLSEENNRLKDTISAFSSDGANYNENIELDQLTSKSDEPILSEEDLEIFRTHLKSHPWIPRSGVAPHKHIREICKAWLGRGLLRDHIAKVQPNLASAYSAEVSKDKSKKIDGLGSKRPELKNPGVPRPHSRRPISALSETEKEIRREKDRGRNRQRSTTPRGPYRPKKTTSNESGKEPQLN